MKKTLLLIATAIFTLNRFSQTVPDYVPTNGLVGWWPFNGNANDESGNGNNGTINGATLTTDRNGNTNSAYNFQNSNYIEINHNSIFNTAQFSISLWYSVSVHDTQVLISKRESSGWGGSFELEIGKESDGTNKVGTTWTTDGNYAVHYISSDITNSTWNNFIITYSVDSVRIYFNGEYVKGEEVNDTQNFNNLPITIGSRGNGWHQTIGNIDEVGIWNRALTECEIQELYNSEITTIDNTVTQTGNTLSATQTGATYQWLDCDDNDAEIVGATSKDFSPGISGNYKVEITVTDGVCTKVDTSECKSFTFLGLDDLNNYAFKVYPNPTRDILTLELNQISNKDFIITDGLGKVVKRGIIFSQKQDIDVSALSKGVYVIKVGEGNQKFIKE